MTFKVKDGVSIAGTLFVDGNRNIVAQATTVTTFNATSTATSTSTTTGAVIISGGVGVGGNLYASAVYDNNARVLTTATVGTYGVTSLTAGTDTSVSTSTGPVVVWNTSTLQTITNRGNSTTNAIYANSLYDNNNRVVTSVVPSGSTYIGVSNVISTGTATSFTISNLGVQTLTAGTDTVVTTSTGSVIVYSTSTLQSVSNRGATTNKLYP